MSFVDDAAMELTLIIVAPSKYFDILSYIVLPDIKYLYSEVVESDVFFEGQ